MNAHRRPWSLTSLGIVCLVPVLVAPLAAQQAPPPSGVFGASSQLIARPLAPGLNAMDLSEWLAAQPVPEHGPPDAVPRTFGTASEVAYVIPAAEFEVMLFSSSFQFVINPAPTAGVFRVPLANITLLAGLRLPAGALITRVEIDGCDSDAAGQIALFLASATSPAGSTPIKTIAGVGTGTPQQPGCALFQSAFAGGITPADRTIDNAGQYYFLALNMNAPGLALSNVRVYYQLQVSSAPAVATFSDVPTNHPFFQFVQALVAAGITAGCGGGQYCVNNPITRGEMAVFLSKALGLHFAP